MQSNIGHNCHPLHDLNVEVKLENNDAYNVKYVATSVSIQLRPSADIVLKKVACLQYLSLAQAHCTVPQSPLRYVLFFCL